MVHGVDGSRLLRSAKRVAAGGFLLAAGAFLVTSFTSGSTTAGIRPGVVWIGTAAAVALAVLVPIQRGRGFVTWVSDDGDDGSTDGERGSDGSSTGGVVDRVLPVIELGLAAIVLLALGWFTALTTSNAGGAGAGAIALVVVLVVGVATGLLSLAVLGGAVLRRPAERGQ